MHKISENVKNFLYSYKITPELDKKILIAFSGGVDSTCLLDVLIKLGYKNLVCLHLNHNWRGDESLQEALSCKNFCKKNDVEFYTETLEENVPHTETYAREARYQFFAKCAPKYDTDIVLTAHNANDNAETLLYRIAKGTGIDGLCGIRPHRDIYYRPLLKISRDKIEEYCKKNGLEPNIDSSNNNTDYKRNLIRHKVLPLLEEINPEVINALNNLSELAAQEEEFFETQLKNTNNSTSLFLNSEAIFQGKKIKELLTKNKIDYDKNRIEKIIRFIKTNSGTKSGKTTSLSKNLSLYVNADEYYVINKTEKITDTVKIDKPGSYQIGEYVFELEECEKIPSAYPQNSDCIGYISTDVLDFELRTRREGDRIKPLGCSGSQKLKKYFNEKKIPTHKKDSIILLCKGQEVLWVEGYGISEKVRVSDRVTHRIKLNKKRGADESST